MRAGSSRTPEGYLLTLKPYKGRRAYQGCTFGWRGGDICHFMTLISFMPLRIRIRVKLSLQVLLVHLNAGKVCQDNLRAHGVFESLLGKRQIDQKEIKFIAILYHAYELPKYTEVPKMVYTWLREICSCSCLPVLLSPAWVLLSKINRPFLGALYMYEAPGSKVQITSLD